MNQEDWISLLKSLALQFQDSNSKFIDENSIEDALYILLSDKFSFEWRGSLWDVTIAFDEAKKLLSGFNFKSLDSKIETDIEIVPKHLVIQYKVRIKSKGLIWTIHKYDADPFPSNPHAHQLENNLKLDLSNGKCYKLRKFQYSISKKNLLDIRSKALKVFDDELPPLSV